MGVRKYADDGDRPLAGSAARCLTRRAWQELQAAHGNRCAYCGRSDRPLLPEHMEPPSRGGDDEPGNIVPACRSCNSSKLDLFPLEWIMAERGPCKRVAWHVRYRDVPLPLGWGRPRPGVRYIELRREFRDG